MARRPPPRPAGLLSATARVGALTAALLVGAAAGGLAQGVDVRAYLTPGNTVTVGAPFTLNVEITGVRTLSGEPRLPDLGAFAQYLSSGTQSAMQTVNGRTTVSITQQYRYQAIAEGTFQIPAFEVSAGGGSYRTEPLQVTVSAQSAGVQGTPGGVTSDDLFITAEATKSRVRDGEPFVVEYRIWTRVDVASFNFTRVPEPEGFWVEDITPAGQPEVQQLTRNGEQYASAVIRRIALVPTGAGVRTIDPIVLEAQVRVRSSDPFDRFFGGRSLLGGSNVPTGVVSETVTVTVEPLPPGAPQPFSGVVGSLELSAALDRDSVLANEAVTLTVRVSGDGNISGVPAPVLDLPDDFEVFPPEVSESVQAVGSGLTGYKAFDFVLIPRAPGAREIPPVTMSYLDAAAGVYRTTASAPLPLTVGGTVVDGPAGLARGGVAELRRDIRFIHLVVPLRPIGRNLYGSAFFWMFALLPLAAIGGAAALRRQRDLLEGDVAYARGRRASKVARKRLAEARRLAGEDDARAFYAEVARALRGLIADRLNVAEAGMQTADVESAVAERGVSAGTAAATKSCLEECDRQRFAPPSVDAEERSRFLERAAELMTRLDREIRR